MNRRTMLIAGGTGLAAVGAGGFVLAEALALQDGLFSACSGNPQMPS